MNKAYNKCANQHFYKNIENKECPYCKKNAKEIAAKHSDMITFESPKGKGKVSQDVKVDEDYVATEYLGTEIITNDRYDATEILTEEDQ